MSYKIAVVSSDGLHIDQSFMEAEEFLIIEVWEDGAYGLKEIRRLAKTDEAAQTQTDIGCDRAASDCEPTDGCGVRKGCGGGNGCGGETSPKLTLIADCRALICTRISFRIQKSLEKRAINTFEVDCMVEQALARIIPYFEKIDRHQSLRGFAKKQSN